MNYIVITIDDINGIKIEIFIKLWKIIIKNKSSTFSNQNLTNIFSIRKIVTININIIKTIYKIKKNC